MQGICSYDNWCVKESFLIINEISIFIKSSFLIGTLGAIIANPIDVIKIRMMVNESLYPSIRHAFVTIEREEGIAGLYKGLAPSTLRGLYLFN
jgi:hypothetical protein